MNNDTDVNATRKKEGRNLLARSYSENKQINKRI